MAAEISKPEGSPLWDALQTSADANLDALLCLRRYSGEHKTELIQWRDIRPDTTERASHERHANTSAVTSPWNAMRVPRDATTEEDAESPYATTATRRAAAS